MSTSPSQEYSPSKLNSATPSGESDTNVHLSLAKTEGDVHCERTESRKKPEDCSTFCNESTLQVSNGAVRKLSKEFSRINRMPPQGIISVKLADDSNLFEWEVVMSGPQDSPFAGGTFRLRLAFPNDYPTSPPKVWFFTEMFHPNVFAEDGRVCIDIKEPQYGIETVLVAVQILLSEPNPLSPANVEAGDLYQTDLPEYERRVRRIVQRSETHRKLSVEEKQLNFNMVKRNQFACVLM